MCLKDCANFFKNNFSFYDKLTDKQKEMLCQNTTLSTYKKGDILHDPQEKCAGVMLIKKGHTRIYMLSEDGKEITLYRLFEGDTCILSASCVLEAITFDVFISAEDDCEIYTINSLAFQKLMYENIYVEAFAYKLATTRFSDVMWAMQQILFMGMDKRVAIFLIDEIAKNNSNVINLTHEQIAKYIGTAREVVSRMLKYFENENIVKLFRGGINIIDKNKLKKIIV